MNARPAATTHFDPVTRRESDWLDRARVLVADLYDRSPAIYWTDFLLSIAGAWGLAAAYFLAPPWSVIQLVAFVLSAVLFLRAGTLHIGHSVVLQKLRDFRI